MWPEALLAMAMALPAGEPREISYLALGDSYTIGESVPEEGRWPVQLAAALRERGVPLAAPRIIATTGWTTDELSAAMDAAEPLGQWDFASLLIGVNNQYRGRPVDEYRGEFAGLLDRTIQLAGGRADRVLVLSIPASRSPGDQPGRIAGDGLHPSAKAYADWTALALPFAERLLADR